MLRGLVKVIKPRRRPQGDLTTPLELATSSLLSSYFKLIQNLTFHHPFQVTISIPDLYFSLKFIRYACFLHKESIIYPSLSLFLSCDLLSQSSLSSQFLSSIYFYNKKILFCQTLDSNLYIIKFDLFTITYNILVNRFGVYSIKLDILL